MDHIIEPRITPVPRGFRNASILAGLLITAASLSQCRMVEDRMTGVDLTPPSASARSSCVHECNEQYKTARKAEELRSRAAIEACGGNNSCKKGEQALRKRNLDALVRQMQRCKRNCYNEGAGVGGR